MLTIALLMVHPTSVHAADQVSQSASEKTSGSPTTSDELLRKGIAAYKKHDYVTARSAFLSAFQQDSVTAVAAMLADVEMKLKRYRDAAEHWNVYLNGLAPDQTSERTEALAQLEACRKHVGTVKVTVEPRDARVVVDGVAVDLTPTQGDLWLEPGKHSLEVKLNDRASEPKDVDISPGDKLDVTLTAPSPPAAPAMPTVAPAPAPVAMQAELPKSSNTKTIVLVGGAVLTVASATVSTIYWVKNRTASDAYDTAIADAKSHTSNPALIEQNAMCSVAKPPSACKRIQSAMDRMNRDATISNVALVATAAFGLATIGTYFLWPRNKDSSTQKAAIDVAPWWTPTSQGIAARIEF